MASVARASGVAGINGSAGRINKKGDWHSTRRLLIACALYYHVMLIIAVARADGALVVFRKGFSQIAGMSRL
jgi:hypothetical protein